MLALGSIFGTLNLANALDLLDNSSPRGQRWSKKSCVEGQICTESETLVTEYVAAASGRTLFQVTFGIASCCLSLVCKNNARDPEFYVQL